MGKLKNDMQNITPTQNPIQKLLTELCPNGVEFKALGEVCEFQKGKNLTKKEIITGDIPIIAGGRKPISFHNQLNRDGETVAISSSGAYSGFVSYWNKPVYLTDSFSITPIDCLLSKYLFYLLQEKQKHLYAMQKGSGVPHVYSKDVAKLKIPIPPLEIQEKIVDILDKFTQLETQLEVELEARKKQYEYYRNGLLDFSAEKYIAPKIRKMLDELCPNGVGFKALGKVCKTLKKGILKTSELIETGGYPVMNSGRDFYGRYNEHNNEGNSITIAARGEYAGFINYISEKFWAGGLCYPYSSKDEKKVLTKFVFYALKERQAIYSRNLVARGSIPALNKGDIDKFKIPIPPLKVQEEIVDILDKFDALINDISIGIPAEISVRKKQYEYYRNKLLTFKEKKTEKTDDSDDSPRIEYIPSNTPPTVPRGVPPEYEGTSRLSKKTREVIKYGIIALLPNGVIAYRYTPSLTVIKNYSTSKKKD